MRFNRLAIKMMVHYYDVPFECEMSIDDLIKLMKNLKNASIIPSDLKTIIGELGNSIDTGKTISPSIKKNKDDLEEYELLLETKSEIKGRNDDRQSVYKIYQNKSTQVLKGRIKTGNKSYEIILGNPNDDSSDIGIISKAVNAMPFQENFTKRQLRESLPNNLSKGNKIKLAMDYLEHVKIIERVKQKDFDTGATMYKRIKTLNENANKNEISEQLSSIKNLNS